MNARQVIEAEDPKSVFRAARDYVTLSRLKQVLEPQGFTFTTVLGEQGFVKYRKTFKYIVLQAPNGGAHIVFYRDYEDGKGLIYHETVTVSNMSYLLKHLRLFRLIEAEDPKRFLKNVSNTMRVTTKGRVTDIVDANNSLIRFTREYAGSPCIGWISYAETVPEEDRAAVGARLLQAAYKYARQQREYRVNVVVGTTQYRKGPWSWDVDRNEDAEIGNLIYVVEPECYTSASGMVRRITLESEDPKSVFRKATLQAGHWDFDRLRRHLEPYGFKAQEMGCRCLEKEMGGKLYSIGVSSYPDKAYIVVYKRGTGGRWRDYTSFTAQYLDLLRPEFLRRIMRGDFDVNLGENVLSLDTHGALKLDKRPKAPRSIWTHRRKREGKPAPYHRFRTLPSGKPVEIFAAYRKDNAPTDLLSKAKLYSQEVAQMASWAADDLAYALTDAGVTLVTPMPSAKPLARRLARLLANRLGVPLEVRIAKSGQVRHIPISKRKAVAGRLYSVSGKLKGEVVCLVDDYIVTSASMMAAAVHAYQAGARKVVGAALAI